MTTNGTREYKTIGLPTFLSVVGGMASVISLLLGWSLAGALIPEQVADRIETRISQRIALENAVDKEIHDRLADGINVNAEAIGKLVGRLDSLYAQQEQRNSRREYR